MRDIYRHEMIVQQKRWKLIDAEISSFTVCVQQMAVFFEEILTYDKLE